MTETVTSFARTLLHPSIACRTVSASITGTRALMTNTYMQYLHAIRATMRRTKDVVRHTQAVAIGSARMVARPLLWPVSLSVDLSRRVLIQVLISLREVLMTLNDLVTTMEKQLSERDRVILQQSPPVIRRLRLKALESTKSEDERSLTEDDDDDNDDDDGDDKEYEDETSSSAPSHSHRKMSVSGDRTLEAWKQHVTTIWKLKQMNLMLKRRVMVTENKYETVNAQVIALKDIYRDKMADMEYDLCDLKKQRSHVMSLIESAQILAQACHGDVQQLKDDVHKITVGKVDDGASQADSLSLDFGLECLTLMSQQKDWQPSHDSDTGFMDDDMETDAQPLPLHRLPHRTCADLSVTSSLTSLSSLDIPT